VVGEDMDEIPATEGGKPARETFLPYCRPSVSQEEIDEVSEVLRSGWLTSGPKVIEFEERFRDYIGSSEAVAINSCTAGLHLSLVALNIGPGDNVITTPMTFASTANVIVNVGATPVFVDIERETLNIDSDKVLDATSKETKAIMPVHYAGNPCNMNRIMEIADEKRIGVVEDAAHAVGAKYADKNIGTFGVSTSFSFYVTKNMTTGEGGMITTNDSEFADKIRMLRMHGIDQDAWKRYHRGGNWYYEVKHAGYKYNMTDVQAALGLVQLRKLDEFNAQRQKMANEFINAMLAENIGVSVHFIPVHRHPFYRKRYNFSEDDFPVANWAYERLVSLPLYPLMTEDDMDDVLTAIEKIVKYYAR
jgi:dTDP-4-amino-4,6-dideoxygalactose transaminase